MAGLNRVILIGNLTDDPELRYTQSGTARARFRIAVNRRFRDQDGNLQEETTFVPIVVWRNQAENCANFLNKGSLVAVDGRLRIDTFEPEEGERRKIVEVVAWNVQFLGGRQERERETERETEEEEEGKEEEKEVEKGFEEEEVPF